MDPMIGMIITIITIIMMNNKRVLARYPNAIAQRFETEFEEGFRGKGVPVYIIKENEDSIYTIGFGYTEKEAWQMATSWLNNKPSNSSTYMGYLIKDAILDME
jgi:hypothetical protein